MEYLFSLLANLLNVICCAIHFFALQTEYSMKKLLCCSAQKCFHLVLKESYFSMTYLAITLFYSILFTVYELNLYFSKY